MIIERIDRDRAVEISCDRIYIVVKGHEFLLTEELGELRIHSSQGRLVVRPCEANEITIGTEE